MLHQITIKNPANAPICPFPPPQPGNSYALIGTNTLLAGGVPVPTNGGVRRLVEGADLANACWEACSSAGYTARFAFSVQDDTGDCFCCAQGACAPTYAAGFTSFEAKETAAPAPTPAPTAPAPTPAPTSAGPSSTFCGVGYCDNTDLIDPAYGYPTEEACISACAANSANKFAEYDSYNKNCACGATCDEYTPYNFYSLRAINGERKKGS